MSEKNLHFFLITPPILWPELFCNCFHCIPLMQVYNLVSNVFEQMNCVAIKPMEIGPFFIRSFFRVILPQST